MDTLLRNASKGNRAALTRLWLDNGKRVFSLCCLLLPAHSEDAAAVTKQSFKAALRAVTAGESSSEADFSAYVLRQAAYGCKKECLKGDARAFRLPPQKNFRISHVNERYLSPNASPIESYASCLPPLQRFALILELTDSMTPAQIDVLLQLDTACAARLREAQAENLAKIDHALRERGLPSVDPTVESLSAALKRATEDTQVPAEVERYVTEIINTLALPLEEKRKKRNRCLGVLTLLLLAAAIVLGTLWIERGNEDDSIVNSAEPTVSAEAEGTDLDGDVTETVTPTEEAEATPTPDVTDTSTEESPSPSAVPAEPEETAEPTADIGETSNTTLTYYADISIQNYGTVTVALDRENAPITTENFITLAESGFYDGLTFHRIIEGFMMQGGDPNGNGTGGSDQTIVGEFTDNGHDNPLSHTRGAVSMARSSAYDSASSQFFIVHEDSTYLDGQYAVFGYVTEGMDIVDVICQSAQPTDSNGTIPAEEQPVISSVTIRTVEG